MRSTPVTAGRLRAAFCRPLVGALVTIAALASLTAPSAAAAPPPPDGRVYELVTPGETGRNVMIQPTMSKSGNRVAYGALASFEGAHSNVLNTYIATRNADGTWTNRPLQRATRAGNPIGWSPVAVDEQNFSFIIAQGLQGLAGGGTFPLDRFDANGNSVETLVQNRQDAAYATSTPGLTRNWIHLSSEVIGQPDSPFGRNLYEARNGTLTNVGLLPDGSVHECGAALTTDFNILQRQHYVSDDGSRIFFVSPDPNAFDCPTSPVPRLYMRSGGVTTPISEAPAGQTEASASFVQATPDGSVVFFLTSTNIAPGDTDGTQDLYRWDSASGERTCVSCVTGQTASVQSPAVVSEDGSRAYFVSSANLVTDPDLTPDVPHIYVNDGSGIRFVANTGQLGASASGFPRGQISADGNILFINATEQLTNFPTNANNAIYRYTDSTGQLICVSCINGVPYTSSVDLSAAGIFQNAAGRAASADGKWVFFSTTAALVPDDVNGGVDTYRWHEGGGIALITDGVSPANPSGLTPNHSYAGMDTTGSNVLFAAFDRLVPRHAGGIQFYTARIGGVPSPFPPPPAPGCLGDGCQGLPAPQPTTSNPGSATLTGPGNVKHAKKKKKAKKCKRGFKRKKVRGKVRCVKRKKRPARSRRAAAERRKAAALRRSR
jgi:hypothetical protein